MTLPSTVTKKAKVRGVWHLPGREFGIQHRPTSALDSTVHCHEKSIRLPLNEIMGQAELIPSQGSLQHSGFLLMKYHAKQNSSRVRHLFRSYSKWLYRPPSRKKNIRLPLNEIMGQAELVPSQDTLYFELIPNDSTVHRHEKSIRLPLNEIPRQAKLIPG